MSKRKRDDPEAQFSQMKKLLDLRDERGLNPKQAQRLAKLERRLGIGQSQVRTQIHKAVSTSFPRRQNREALSGALENSGSGPGFPGLHVELDESVQAPQAEVVALLKSLNIDDAYNDLCTMSQNVPNVPVMPVRIYSDANYEFHQSSMEVDGEHLLEFDNQTGRVFMRPNVINSAQRLDLNLELIRHMPEEARGVLYHEFGHLHTQRIFMAYPGGCEAYREAFAEIYKSAAALAQGARWEQANGASGYQVLHGDKEPKLIPNSVCKLPTNLYNASRFIACNRILELLGGLNSKVLCGVSKACSMQSSREPIMSLEDLLAEIETHTGVRGFKDEFLNDPVLRPGNIQRGVTAVALRNMAGNTCRIQCFEIVDTAPDYGWSKHTYDESERQLLTIDEDHFHLQGVQVRNPTFELSIRHKGTGLTMAIQTDTSFDASPFGIFKQAIADGADWPTGPMDIQFRLGNNPWVTVNKGITITEEDKNKIYNCFGATRA